MPSVVLCLYCLLPVIAAVCLALVALSCTKRQRERFPWLQKLDGKKLFLNLIAVLCLVSTGLLTFWKELDAQRGNKAILNSQEETKEEVTNLRKAVTRYADVQSKLPQQQPQQTPAQLEQRTYDELAKQLGIDPKLLREKLPHFANELKHAPNATTYERASAAYVTKDYAEAERLSLSAADQAQKATPPKLADVVNALQLAGNSAQARIEYADALRHFRDAENLTDRARDPLLWARQQWNIANAFLDQGKFAEAEKSYRLALEEYGHNTNALVLRNNLAATLGSQGKYAEAEMQYQDLIKVEQTVLGPKDPDTLMSRGNLATLHSLEGKYPEAEVEFRELLNLRKTLSDPLHPDTLTTRNNLASTLGCQGKYAEAETELRDVVKLKEKVFGPEHPETLGSRLNLANVLAEQAKYAEAEPQFRELIMLEERVLGPDHPDTLTACYDFAVHLKAENKLNEAKEFARRAAQRAPKILPPDDPLRQTCEKFWQELQTNN